MSDLIERIEEISKEQFLKAWEKEDETSGHPDKFMEDRRAEHKRYMELQYYVATITKHGLNNLVLWHHIEPEGQVRVQRGGELFWRVVSTYWQQIQNSQSDACLVRLQKIVGELDSRLWGFSDFLETDYSLGRVYNHRHLAIDNEDYYQDHGKSKLYVGNFHRFVGYGLWLKKHEYQPIKVYYCEQSV